MKKIKSLIALILLLFLLLPNFFNPDIAISQDDPVCHYNACNLGSLCYLGDMYYSPGDYIFDDAIDFYASELKTVPQPLFYKYRHYICRLRDCQSGADSTIYCEIGAVRNCGVVDPYDPYGGTLMSRCEGDLNSVGPPNGRWVSVASDTPASGDCEDMLDTMKIAFTPGYIQTQTPYLFNIWRNTVDKTQAVFTPFRTVLDQPVLDWPGESTITYDFDPVSGEGHAEAGQPPYLYPGWYAKMYFRYLGYIHCAKENLLNKISPFLEPNYPYIYYDERCNMQLW